MKKNNNSDKSFLSIFREREFTASVINDFAYSSHIPKTEDNFSIFLAISVAIHLLLIYIFLFGIPTLFASVAEEQVITFEMIPIENISNIPAKQAAVEKETETQEAKKVSKTQTSPPKVEEKPEEQPAPEKPEEKKPEEERPKEQKPDPKPSPEIVKPEKKEELLKPEEKKSNATAKPEIKKDIKKEINKKLPTSNDLESLLKNLEKASAGNNKKSGKQANSEITDNQKDSKGAFNEEKPLSLSEKAAVRQQIEKHWNIPVGAEGIDQIKIMLYIALDKDGTVLMVKVKDKVCPPGTAIACQLIADSAARAVWSASPLENLPVSRYNIWKEFDFTFDPRQMAS